MCTPTTLDTLLLALKSQVETKMGLQDNTVFVGLSPDENMFQASDQYVVVTPGPQAIANGYVAGTNPTTLAFNGTVSVTLWSRLGLDQAPRSEIFLTDSTYGAIPALGRLISALHLFYPVDTNGNKLTLLPVKVDKIDSYARDFKGVGWGALKVSFRLVWRMSS